MTNKILTEYDIDQMEKYIFYRPVKLKKEYTGSDLWLLDSIKAGKMLIESHREQSKVLTKSLDVIKDYLEYVRVGNDDLLELCNLDVRFRDTIESLEKLRK